MSIHGARPESGVRIELERPREGPPPWSYRGTASRPIEVFDARVIVSEAGDVDVSVSVSVSRSVPLPHAAVPAAALPHAALPAALPVAGPERAASEALALGDLASQIRLLVRTAYRQARADGEPPAFRIVRWRADK